MILAEANLFYAVTTVRENGLSYMSLGLLTMSLSVTPNVIGFPIESNTGVPTAEFSDTYPEQKRK